MTLNSADKTLLTSFGVFCLCLWYKLENPGDLDAEGLLFASEAAVVGGAADWFAVTALFEKPLGWPYHTALLPRRRPEFCRAAIRMIQQEFLSRRRIFQHIEKLHIFPMLLNWLNENDTKADICLRLRLYLETFLQRRNTADQAKLLAGKLRDGLNCADLPALFAKLGKSAVAAGRDRELLEQMAAYLQKQAAAPSTKAAILAWLEKYEREKAQSPFELLMAGLAEAFDLINLEEAAELLQKQLVKSLRELGERDSELQREILALFHDKAAELNQDKEFQRLAGEVRSRLVAELPLEEILIHSLAHFRRLITKDEQAVAKLTELLGEEYDRLLKMLGEDNALHRDIHRVVYDIIARSALHAQKLVGPTVEDALGRMTDEELNHLVYDKIEPDLLYIRMNGSTVGFVIGLMLFACFNV